MFSMVKVVSVLRLWARSLNLVYTAEPSQNRRVRKDKKSLDFFI